MIRKKKKFEWPRKIYDSKRIKDENSLVEKYGLKNKREIWKVEAKLKYFRNRAKLLITSNEEEKKVFFDKLNNLGLKVNSVSDVLALNKEDFLKIRLASVVHKKGIANTPKQARQMIVHKKIKIGNRIVNVPSYMVKLNEINHISLRRKVKAPKTVSEIKKENEISEITEEVDNE